ncbi:MAG: hypothetical protein AB7T17_01845 [Geobacter sp.]|uniref:hypothetical protein n=1 Tax=Trichlorobacter sp. TaxID=2911007 RepID=UPI002A362771|nr:hypothetical protein [Trichlorobacter sp.]MDY0384461.1 hypothetical protein [Trichlorobacter sp.]
MEAAAHTVAWVCLPDKTRTLSGGCWQERCYPFRGVLPAERADSTVERQRMLDDYRIALEDFDTELRQQ